MIQTILFDWDGTLLNSNDLINESNSFVLKTFGIHGFNKEEIKQLNGPSLLDIYRKINPVQANQMLTCYRKYSDSRHDQMVTLFPKVENTLKELGRLGIDLGIVSMKRGAMVRQGVKLFNLEAHFKVIIGGDECNKTKPDPESLEMAMDCLDAKRATTVMVGDNWHDIEAANQSDIRSVFVSWSEKEYEQVAKYSPSYVINSIEDLLDLVIQEDEER